MPSFFARRNPRVTPVNDHLETCRCYTVHLELGERLDSLAGAGKDTENVEADLQEWLEW